MKKTVEENLFTLEGLVVPESSTKTSPKTGQKAARKRGEPSFVQITAAQAHRLIGISPAVTVFFYLMFRDFKAFHRPFVLLPNAMEYAGIDRHVQLRALRSLEKRGLILMDRDGPRKPPTITIVGVTKRR